MVNIIDNRFKNTVKLKDIEEGECFICDGTLFRKVYTDEVFNNVEYMYSGFRIELDPNTRVTPVDVEIIIDNEGEI